MRNVCKDESSDQKWILFDGPVDTLWIESMNTTLDDNKLLTLLSGERISMPAQVSLLFEVEDLSQASPATVSRAGMIYLNVEDLGWQPMVTSWLNDPKGNKAGDAVLTDTLSKCFERFMGPCLEFRRRECKELVSTPPLQSVLGTCNMFDCIATADNKCSPAEGESYVLMIELNFLFSLVWSVGATIDEEGRKKFDLMLRELDGRFPSQVHPKPQPPTPTPNPRPQPNSDAARCTSCMRSSSPVCVGRMVCAAPRCV
jgi:dynein heavy chain